MMFWIGVVSVMSMKSSARSAFFEPVGMTQMLPLRTGARVLPGKRKMPHLNFVISVMNEPYHQAAGGKIGAFARFERVARLLGSQRYLVLGHVPLRHPLCELLSHRKSVPCRGSRRFVTSHSRRSTGDSPGSRTS